MSSGALYAAAVGLFFLCVGVVQWFAPELHRLSRVVSQSDGSTGGKGGQKSTESVVRAVAVVGMYIAGLFLTLAWTPVSYRLYDVFVRLFF